MPLSEATKAFLETAFLPEMANLDRRKRVEKFGVPECDFVIMPEVGPSTQVHVAQKGQKGRRVSVLTPAILAGCGSAKNGGIL